MAGYTLYDQAGVTGFSQQSIDDRRDRVGIDVGGRLISQQHRWCRPQRPNDHSPLDFTARTTIGPT